MEKPTKQDLLKELDEIDKLIRERLAANPDPATVDTLLEIRKKQQELVNLVLAM